MKARDFDPVFSAALRNELEHLADSPEPAAVAVLDRLRRPQVWVTVVTAVVLIAATIGVLNLVKPPTVAPPADATIVDPLTQLRDPAYPDHVENVVPLLEERGVGPGVYRLSVPPGVRSVRSIIRCAPSAQFRITMVKAVRAQCDAVSQSGFGDVPVTDASRAVFVSVPEGTAWRLVVIATPGTTDPTLSWLRVTTPPVPTYPVPEYASDVPVGLAHGGAGTTAGQLDVPVDGIAVVTSCRGSGGLVIRFSNGLQFGTDAAPFRCGAGDRSTGAARPNTADGYRSEGRLRYTVRAVGDITWSATFSSRVKQGSPSPIVAG